MNVCLSLTSVGPRVPPRRPPPGYDPKAILQIFYLSNARAFGIHLRLATGNARERVFTQPREPIRIRIVHKSELVTGSTPLKRTMTRTLRTSVTQNAETMRDL